MLKLMDESLLVIIIDVLIINTKYPALRDKHVV